MLIYYDHYGRNAQLGAAGFCFYGNRWPQGINPNISDLHGAGYLWNLFTNLYGDQGVNVNTPQCIFVLRDCFDALHATVYGVAYIHVDEQGRAGTCVDFGVCIPENAQEAEKVFAPDSLLNDLRTQHQPGTTVQYTDNFYGGKAPQVTKTAIMLGKQMAWKQQTILVLSDHSETSVYDLACQLNTILPEERKKKFSFVSRCTNWVSVAQMCDIDLIGVQATLEAQSTAARMQREGIELAFWQAGDSAVQFPPHTKQPAALTYLQRIYSRLLDENLLNLPAQSAHWLRGSKDYGKACTAMDDLQVKALAMMLRAAASQTGIYYPTAEEKRGIATCILL